MFGQIGMTGDDIYRNFHDGQGPDGLISGTEVVNDVAGTYGERARQIRALVNKMESAWQGDAAGAALRGAGPLAAEHEISGMALGTAQDLMGRQAGSFSEAKSRVVPVPPKPELVNPAAVFTDPTAVIEHERLVDEHRAAAQNNVDVMNGYSGASEYNTTNLPTSYGGLSEDQAGVDIRTIEIGGAGGSVITSIDSTGPGDTGRSTDAGRDVGDSSVGGDRSPVGGSGHPAPPGPDSGGPGSGSPDSGPGSRPLPGITSPETFLPGVSTPPVGSVDTGTGRSPGTPAVPPPGVGAVVAGPGGFGGAPRGGSAGGSPGIGPGPYSPGGPRDGRVAGGPGAGAGIDPHGSAARSGPGTGTAGGRGGAPGGGIPVGAPGRGHDGEDTEHKRPDWLEGGDPDELFGTDVATAPPTIGAEDD